MALSIVAIARGARMSRSTACEAIKALETAGFLTVARQRKRVQGVFGVKIVQDISQYAVHLAQGLGAVAVAACSQAPESGRKTAFKEHLFIKEEKEKDCNREKKFVHDYISYGMAQQEFGPS